MTLRLARALVDVGNDVTVHPTVDATEHVHDGVRIVTEPIPHDVDVVVCHADYGIRARKLRKHAGIPIVAICHNSSSAVKVGLTNTAPALAVVNSETMAAAIGYEGALVVNPPAPRVTRMRQGRCVTTLSLNELKGGAQFWRVADALPRQPFLAVQGGYGDQIVEHRPNVRTLAHVPAEDLPGRVWRHTGIFLQLSESESWGMAAAEAIAHGIPVIAHQTPGLVENLGPAALYVDREDTEGIAAAITLIQQKYSYFSELAYQRAEQHEQTSRIQVAQWVTAVERLAVTSDG